MSFLREFLLGFSQPVRDFIASYFLYFGVTLTGYPIESTITTPGGYFFSIWVFLVIYLAVAVVDHLLGMAYDTTVIQDNPMGGNMRFLGAVIGIFVWGSGLIDAYASMGGNLFDVIISVAVAGIAILAGIYLRNLLAIERYRERLRIEREFRP